MQHQEIPEANKPNVRRNGLIAHKDLSNAHSYFTLPYSRLSFWGSLVIFRE